MMKKQHDDDKSWKWPIISLLEASNALTSAWATLIHTGNWTILASTLIRFHWEMVIFFPSKTQQWKLGMCWDFWAIAMFNCTERDGMHWNQSSNSQWNIHFMMNCLTWHGTSTQRSKRGTLPYTLSCVTAIRPPNQISTIGSWFSNNLT